MEPAPRPDANARHDADAPSTDSASTSGVSPDSGFTLYFEHDDLDTLVARLQADGFVFEALPADQRWLWREARLRDPSGNLICLYRAGAMRRHPPWRVERRADDAG